MKKTPTSKLILTKSAFTLIELLVVIGIIGILAAVTLGSMQNARDRGEAAKVVGDVKLIKGALQFRYSDNTQYPTEEQIETDYPALVGQTKSINNLIAADVFDGKFTNAPISRIGTADYVYDADASDGATNYDMTDCGNYTNNEYGVNIIIPNAISSDPNIVSQLDGLIDSNDGLDCGFIRRASGVDNNLLYTISVNPAQFP